MDRTDSGGAGALLVAARVAELDRRVGRPTAGTGAREVDQVDARLGVATEGALAGREEALEA